MKNLDAGSNREQNDPIHPRKKAFTLAEVLIVLGVIGIVAALTIPPLLKNWQEDRWDTAAKVFESRLIEAVSQMHARQRLTGRPTTEAFVTDLQHFMKVTEVCTTPSSCFAPSFFDEGDTVQSNTFTTAGSFGKDWDTSIVGYKLANGANVLISYNKSCMLDPAASGKEVSTCSIAALYDTNGSAEPNVLGKDVRFFNASRTKITCNDGSKVSWSKFGNISITNCDILYFDEDAYTCPNNGDCFASAQQACAAIGGRLPKFTGTFGCNPDPDDAGYNCGTRGDEFHTFISFFKDHVIPHNRRYVYYWLDDVIDIIPDETLMIAGEYRDFVGIGLRCVKN